MNFKYLFRKLKPKIILALMFFSCTAATAQWRYKNFEDKMRRSITQIAEIRSTNKANLDFPYKGGSTLELNLRRRDSKEDDDVFFSIDRGQIPCLNICTIFSKFDNDEVIEWGGIGAESGRSDLIFIGKSQEFIERLKSAKNLIIEIQIYNHGRFQFNFNVSGLKWKSQDKKIDKQNEENSRIELQRHTDCAQNRDRLMVEARHNIGQLHSEIKPEDLKGIIELNPGVTLSLENCPQGYLTDLAIGVNDERRRLFQLLCVDRKNQRRREALTNGYHKVSKVCGKDYASQIMPWTNLLDEQRKVYQEQSSNLDLWNCRIWRDYSIFGDKASKGYWGRQFEENCLKFGNKLDSDD